MQKKTKLHISSRCSFAKDLNNSYLHMQVSCKFISRCKLPSLSIEIHGFFLTTFWLESQCLVRIKAGTYFVFSVERERDDGMNEKANSSTLVISVWGNNPSYIQLQALSCYSPLSSLLANWEYARCLLSRNLKEIMLTKICSLDWETLKHFYCIINYKVLEVSILHCNFM